MAVRAQLLDGERPTDLLDVVHHLTFVQLDPTAAVAPSADLVLYGRLGPSYRPEHLQAALEEHHTLFEHRFLDLDEPRVAVVRPVADLGLYLAQMATVPEWEGSRRWFDSNARFRAEILDVLRRDGPLLSRDITATCDVPWESRGWTNNRNVTQMLEYLLIRGEVAVSGRRGKQRLWDLPERVYRRDGEVAAVPGEEAHRRRSERRLASLGIARPKKVGDAGEAAEVEGTAGEWRVDPGHLDRLGRPFAGRTALLSPFDRLIHDRKRTEELFGFEYLLEMYKPPAKRRWGYFALPVLHHDRLVGKLDATADRKAGVFRVDALHEDVPFTGEMTAGVRAEVEALAAWLGLDVRWDD
jgi:uncharacterized protein YcaQ